jgi:hypothetical protein
MAKKAAVKEKYAGRKGKIPGMEVKTPYPKEVKPDEIDYLGNKLADLSERVNETELSISDLTNKLKVVMGRMGL